MSKKNWVKVKRGLVDDPKHREAIGEAIWLYLHILDRTDFETGVAFDWKDADEAESLDLDVTTLRRQRRRLEQAGYIRTEQKQHKQLIYVNNWTNPRSYSGEVLNQGSARRPPSTEVQGGHQGSVESTPSEPQGGHQGGHQGRHPSPPVSINSSCIMNHEKSSAKPRKPESRDDRVDQPIIQVVKDILRRYPDKSIWDDIIKVGKTKFDEGRLRYCAKEWAKVSGNMFNLTWLFEWYVDGIPGRKNGNRKASQVGAGSNALDWMNPLLQDIETFKTSHSELFDRCEELSDLICSGISEQEARGKFAELKLNA